MTDPADSPHRADTRPTRRTALKTAVAGAGAAGAAAFAGSQAFLGNSPSALASEPRITETQQRIMSVRADATRIDLGAAKYGAKGDGSDDTAALRAWRDDIAAALRRGATGVYAAVPCGLFAIDGSLSLDILGDNVHLAGDGRGASIITQLPHANRTLLTTPGSGPTARFSISDITIDGNGLRQSSAAWCCELNGYGFDIDNVDLLHGSGGGLSSRWADPGGNRFGAFSARVRGLQVCDTTGVPGSGSPTYGILWAGPHDSQFSDIVISTLVAGQSNTGPSYGFVQATGAAGEYITNMHVWGRHHYGIWSDPLANVVAEGAFLVNAVLTSGSTWSGGEAYGTNGNGGTQPNETGIALGIAQGAPHVPPAPGTTDGFTTTSTIVQGVRLSNFDGPGACVDFSRSAGANVIQAVATVGGSNPLATLARGRPQPSDEVFLLGPGSGVRLVQSLGPA